jgi:hypothetical protein
MTNNAKLAIASTIANVPIVIALALSLSQEPTQEETFDRVSKYALAYEEAVDKEEYMTRIYEDIKSIDESSLPPALRTFVINVKVSQFCK